MTRWYFETFGVPVVVVHHYPDLLLELWLLVSGLVLLFGLRPAIKASRMMPLEVMGQQGQPRPRPWLSKLTTRMPTTMSLGLRSTLRKPTRLALTIVALGLSLMIVGGSLLMFVSMQDSIRGSLDEAEAWDAQVNFLPEQGSDMINWSAAHPGVEAEWYLMTQGNASGDERRFAVYGLEAFSTDGASSMHASRLVEGRLPVSGLSPVEVLVDEGTMELLEWEADETLDIVIAGHIVKVRIVGVSQELGRSLWLYRSDLNAILGTYQANGLYIRGLEPDTPAAKELERLSFVVYHDDMVEGFDAAWKQQSAAMGTFLISGGIIAIMVLINTLFINLTERDAELATLRVLGASRRSLTYILLVEHTLIGLAGGIVGALVSILTAHWFAAAFTTWSFFFVITIDWLLVVYLILFVLIASVLTTFVGTWRIGRMDLVAKVKEWGS